MIYRALGLMSGSSLDGLDIVFAELEEQAGNWNFEIVAADCYPYSVQWREKLQNAISLNAFEYQLLHTEYGHYLGFEVNRFMEENGLQYKIAIIASHGHTTFHIPSKRMTAQLGDGAAIAARTGLPVVTDLRALDVAFGGQGAPIVPVGEKLLLKEYQVFLNLGGIANISFNLPDHYIAFDICPANRVLNLITKLAGKEYDEGGKMASEGKIHEELLKELNELPYYNQPYPKSLANDFGTDIVFPLILKYNLSINDALRTYVQHIAQQIKRSVESTDRKSGIINRKLLSTGGGALNSFLIKVLSEELKALNIEVIVPDERMIKYKEALVMAFIGVLRWRQENTVLASVTGAERDSIGGAVWIGQEA